jgi:hypothetical protein
MTRSDVWVPTQASYEWQACVQKHVRAAAPFLRDEVDDPSDRLRQLIEAIDLDLADLHRDCLRIRDANSGNDAERRLAVAADLLLLESFHQLADESLALEQAKWRLEDQFALLTTLREACSMRLLEHIRNAN